MLMHCNNSGAFVLLLPLDLKFLNANFRIFLKNSAQLMSTSKTFDKCI
jgi:hypothetical protein